MVAPSHRLATDNWVVGNSALYSFIIIPYSRQEYQRRELQPGFSMDG